MSSSRTARKHSVVTNTLYFPPNHNLHTSNLIEPSSSTCSGKGKTLEKRNSFVDKSNTVTSDKGEKVRHEKHSSLIERTGTNHEKGDIMNKPDKEKTLTTLIDKSIERNLERLNEKLSVSTKEAERPPPKSLDQRSDVLREIFTTERNYVYDLSILVCLYLKPLQVDDSLLPKEDINTIFMNIEVLYRLSNEFLCKLESVFPDLDKIEEDTALGPILLQIGHFLKLYSTYCSNYKNSLEHCIMACKSYPAFAQFLKDTQANPECKGLSLSDYLIKPVQRLCKYPLLFRELAKVTPSDHPDYPSVVSTQELFQNVTEVANNISAQKENFERLLNFCTIVDGIQDDKVLQSGRPPIRDDWFQIHSQKLTCNSHLYLFPDTLVFTKRIRWRSSKGNQKGGAANGNVAAKIETQLKNQKMERLKLVLFLKNIDVREQQYAGQTSLQVTDLSSPSTIEERPVYNIIITKTEKIQWTEDIRKCIVALEKENQPSMSSNECLLIGDKENGFKQERKKAHKKMKPQILKHSTKLRESSNTETTELKVEPLQLPSTSVGGTSTGSGTASGGIKHRKLRRAETTCEPPSKAFKAEVDLATKKNFAMTRARKSSSDLHSYLLDERSRELPTKKKEGTSYIPPTEKAMKERRSEMKEKLLELRDKRQWKCLSSVSSVNQLQFISVPSLPQISSPSAEFSLPTSHSSSSLPYPPSKEVPPPPEPPKRTMPGYGSLRRRTEFQSLNEILDSLSGPEVPLATQGPMVFLSLPDNFMEDGKDSQFQPPKADSLVNPQDSTRIKEREKNTFYPFTTALFPFPVYPVDAMAQRKNSSLELSQPEYSLPTQCPDINKTDNLEKTTINITQVFPANKVANARSCYQCRKNIPSQLAAIETLDRFYHPTCFVCSTCNKTMLDIPFFVSNQELLCADCSS